ncbi:MAG TPA: flagellar biosynthesis repressor FlbT [Xanthobacteraceae bacterium]|nr:flagellar biosynthesis repressor FlbT [Xanthobacteraceae bacterium]
MALTIELKPGERVILGDCVVTNRGRRTRISIEGDVPILREKDILGLSGVDSPAKRIYYAVQLIYTSKRPQDHHEFYLGLVRRILKAAPSTRPYIDRINNRILTGELYKALKETRKLIAYEKGLLDHALRQQRLCESSQGSGGPARTRSELAPEGGGEVAGGA